MTPPLANKTVKELKAMAKKAHVKQTTKSPHTKDKKQLINALTRKKPASK